MRTDQTGLSDREYSRIQEVMAKHADLIRHTGLQLATNFDVPAQRIINHACAQMRIQRIDWEKIEAVRNNWEFEAPPQTVLNRWEKY